MDATRGYLELSSEEIGLLRYVGAHYAHTVVVVNSTNTMAVSYTHLSGIKVGLDVGGTDCPPVIKGRFVSDYEVRSRHRRPLSRWTEAPAPGLFRGPALSMTNRAERGWSCELTVEGVEVLLLAGGAAGGVVCSELLLLSLIHIFCGAAESCRGRLATRSRRSRARSGM